MLLQLQSLAELGSCVVGTLIDSGRLAVHESVRWCDDSLTVHANSKSKNKKTRDQVKSSASHAKEYIKQLRKVLNRSFADAMILCCDDVVLFFGCCSRCVLILC